MVQKTSPSFIFNLTDTYYTLHRDFILFMEYLQTLYNREQEKVGLKVFSRSFARIFILNIQVLTPFILQKDLDTSYTHLPLKLA